MNIYLAAIVAGDLDLVVSLLVAELGSGHATFDVVERDAFRLLHSWSRGLLGGVVAGGGSIGHACPEEQQQRDRCSHQQRLCVRHLLVHSSPPLSDAWAEHSQRT